MSESVYINWEQDDFTWNAEDRLWEDVYIIVGELIGGGGRNPQELEDEAERLRLIQDRIDKLDQTKKDKLIKVILFIEDEKHTAQKRSRSNIKVTTKDIQTITANYLKLEIKL